MLVKEDVGSVKRDSPESIVPSVECACASLERRTVFLTIIQHSLWYKLNCTLIVYLALLFN